MRPRRPGTWPLLATGCAALALPALVIGAAPGDLDRLATARTLRLDNGLAVVLQRVPERPVVAVQMYYRVGARNEPTGVTGIAHFIEHMLFRGTVHFGLADVTGVIERAGGEWHGYTWLDGTTYFEAAPADLLPTLLRLEAERMTSARMARDEVEPERGAVFQEYRGYQLDPRSDLADAVAMARFLQHPYRNNTMGWESDLQAITPDDLVAFYRRWYGPRNAVLAIAGDIDLGVVERQVREQFGAIEAGGDDPGLRTVEPEPSGQRRLRMERPGAAPAIMIAFPAPAALEARSFAALLVLDAVLGRAKGLSFERHSGDLTTGQPVDPESRLGALAGQDGPAAAIGTALVATAYPYQYLLAASPAAGRSLDEVETSLFALLARTAATLTDDEIASARRRIAAADDLETDGLVEMTHEMAFWTALGGLDRRAAIRREVEVVSLDEVRAAATRLVPERSVVARLTPTGSPAEPAPPSAAPAAIASAPGPAAPETGTTSSPAAPPAAEPAGAPPAPAASPSIGTFDLAGHGRVIVDARPAQRTFVLRLVVAPAEQSPGDDPTAARLRGAAAGLRADRDMGARLAESGIGVSVEGPDDAPVAAHGTLRIHLAGPAERLPQAAHLLTRSLRRALDGSDADPPELSSDPAERALQMLAAARQLAAPNDAVVAASPGGAATRHASGRPWRLLAGLVSPFGGPVARAALDPIAAAAVGAPASRSARSPGTAPLVAPHAGSGGRDDPSPFLPGRRLTSIPGIAQGRLLYALPGDSDPAAQEAVAWLLHHNYSGRLGVKAIAQMGLVYEMESESVPGPRPLVYVSMGADPDSLGRLDAALDAVLGSTGGGLTEEEVAAYRSYARSVATVRLADPDRAARLWTAALLRGEDHRSPALCAGRAARLTLEDVAAAARRMLDPKHRLTVIVGRAAPGQAPRASR
jgi:zinc protease